MIINKFAGTYLLSLFKQHGVIGDEFFEKYTIREFESKFKEGYMMLSIEPKVNLDLETPVEYATIPESAWEAFKHLVYNHGGIEPDSLGGFDTRTYTIVTDDGDEVTMRVIQKSNKLSIDNSTPETVDAQEENPEEQEIEVSYGCGDDIPF